MKKLIIACLVLLIACQNIPDKGYTYFEKHPDFQSPHKASTLYQIVIHRSWRDTIFIEFESRKKGKDIIRYSISGKMDAAVESFQEVYLNKAQSKLLKKSFDELKFFEKNEPCAEKSYKLDYYYYFDRSLGRCDNDILVMDGGNVSFLAKDGRQRKAIAHIDSSDNNEIVQFSEYILGLAGVKEEAIPRWEN